MKSKFFNKATDIAKYIIRESVKDGDIVIDATAGNGNDTAFLADQVGVNGKVFAFDIQDMAIQNTRKKLQELNLINRVTLIEDGHENIDFYVKNEVNLIIFNLGYLPKGDHKIITKSETTIIALKKGLELLSKNGILLVVIYSGHEGGKEESIEVENLLSSLDQREYNTIKIDFINQKNKPPVLIGVEKKG